MMLNPVVTHCRKFLAAPMFAAAVLFAAPAGAQVPPPPIAAKAWMLFDVSSGQVLASVNEDQRVEPASITKLMTAYLVFSALRDGKIELAQTVAPSDIVLKVKSEESRMFIEPNKPVSIQDLLQGLIVQSGNDAALVLAELVGGSVPGFIEMMNREAEHLGMKETRFTNPTGLPDPNHYSTAQDLSILASRLILDFPQYYSYYSQKEFKYNGIKQPNRNRLLWLDSTVDGLKTGHTSSAGYCLVATARRPLPGLPGKPAGGANRRLLSVVLGTASETVRAQESLKLLNYGFQHFDAVRFYDKGQVIATPEVWKGKRDSVKMGVRQATYVSVPKGSAERLKPILERREKIMAPVAEGEVLGSVKLMDGTKLVAEFPVVALEAVPEAGFFGRLWDTIRMWFKG